MLAGCADRKKAIYQKLLILSAQRLQEITGDSRRTLETPAGDQWILVILTAAHAVCVYLNI